MKIVVEQITRKFLKRNSDLDLCQTSRHFALKELANNFVEDDKPEKIILHKVIHTTSRSCCLHLILEQGNTAEMNFIAVVFTEER
jgi:hypothetical protein